MKLNLTATYKIHSRIKPACGPSIRVLLSFLLCALAVLLFPIFSAAQTATGAQPLGSITSGPDAINLGNLNIHYAFPVFSRPGRGINFTYVLSYDSSIYQPLISGSTTAWTPVTNFGWRGQTEIATGYISEKSITQDCFYSGTHDLGGWTTRTTYAYHDPFGATHALGTQVTVDNEGASNCPANSDPPFDSEANDNSGYGLHADDTSIYVTAKGGAQIHAPVTVTTGAANATDSNGNQITVDSSGNFSDTLGTVALSITGSQTAPPMSFNYHDTSGAQQSVVVTYGSFTVQTHFGCAGIGEYGPYTTNLPTSISYPDNSSYTITYEPTPTIPGAVTGRVASVQLRTGGTISYVYKDGNNGVECSDGSTAGFNRTTPDGTMQYDRSGGGTQWTTTVQDATTPPNYTVISFQTAGPNPVNYYETKRQLYAGSTTGTLLRTIDTCYNNAAPDCTAAAITLPITQVNVFTTLENGLQSKVASSFDSIFGRPTETDEYDFGSGAPGALLRKTLTTYAFDSSSVCPNHNVPPDRVCTVTVQDGSGTQVARTQYGYDETAVTATSGVPHHLAASARGNLTSIQQWLNSPASTLTTTLAYDDTGNVLSTTDPGGHITGFSYTDSFSDSASLNSLAYVTTVTLPTTHSPGTQTHTTTAKYEVNTGLVTDSYGQNNEHTSFSYDALLRPTLTYFNSALQTEIQYWDTSGQIWTWNYLDANNHTDFRQHIDSMGRIDRTAFLNQEGSWDMQDTCFDANSRPAFTSYTYQDANGWGDPSRCSGAGDAFAYDALSRPVSVTHGDSSQANYAYAGRASQISDEGNGSKTVTRILQSDGLGRLTNVCEVSSTNQPFGSGSAYVNCGLDYPNTGFLTTYGYDTLNNLIHLDQGSLAVRTYVYDSLSRMTSEQFPEQAPNTTTYSYDNDSLLHTRVRPAPNNAGGSVTTTYNYDEMHRLRTVTYAGDPTGTPSSTYNYDETSAWTQNLTNTIGRMTSAYAGPVPGIAASLFSYDVNGRPTQNWQCTPRTCGTSAYYLPYSYDQMGNVLTAGNGVAGSGNATLTYTYNPAARLTQLTSSWNDASHPPNLLSNAHYGPFGLTTDTLGNGLNEYYTYHSRGWLQSASFGGSPSGYAQGAVQFSGSEQLHNATNGVGTVTVGFSEPAADQVQTAAATQATGWVSISGSEGTYKRVPCASGIAPPPSPLVADNIQAAPTQNVIVPCYMNEYDSGGISVSVNGVPAGSVSWGQGSDQNTMAGLLANSINNNNSSPVTAAAGIPTANSVTLTSKAYGAGANYPLSVVTADDDPTNFPTPHFSGSASGPTLTKGQDATYATYYDNGQATLCINGNCGYHYNWNQNDSASTVAAGLAAAVQADTGRLVNASANGATITLNAIAQGSVGNYSLSASSSYDSAHFGGPATSFSVSGMSNGSDGLPDSGTATLTVAGLTKTYTWGASDTSSLIANNLAGQLHADPSRQADYTSVGSCGLNCSQINLQALAAGPDPSYNGGISHSDPSGYFPTSSFSSSPTGATAMTGGATGSPSIYSYALGFAPDGSITSSNDSANGNWTYGYDEFNRLTSSNKNSGTQTFTYAYDRLGNRWQQTAPQGGPAPQYNFDSNNHISGSGVSYDQLGNVLNDGLGNSYLYDAENRVASVNGVSYVYDAFGQRVKTPSAEYLYDLSGKAVSMLDPSTGTLQYSEIYAGGRHIATYNVANNTTAFLYTDWLGSLRAVAGPTGSSVETCTGLPFGDGASCTGTDYTHFHFTGDEHDATGNLEHTLFRQLSTTQGRWISPDPSGMRSVTLSHPQTLNMYGYVGSRPTSRIDVAGLAPLESDPANQSSGCPDSFFSGCEGGGFGSGIGGGGCVLNGMPMPCSLVGSAIGAGAAVPCPNNYCGPINSGGVWWFFSASADGSSGYVPQGFSGYSAGDLASLRLTPIFDCSKRGEREIDYSLQGKQGLDTSRLYVTEHQNPASWATGSNGTGMTTDRGGFEDHILGWGIGNSIQTFTISTSNPQKNANVASLGVLVSLPGNGGAAQDYGALGIWHGGNNGYIFIQGNSSGFVSDEANGDCSIN